MVDSLVESIVTALGGKISSELVAFIVSLLPVLELRGGLVAAKLMDIDFFKAFAICYIGNMSCDNAIIDIVWRDYKHK